MHCQSQAAEGDAKRPLEGGTEAPPAKKPESEPAQPAKVQEDKTAESEEEESESEEESDSEDSDSDSDEVS